MSYCRVSTDDWSSDVYVYASRWGWQTHVARVRTAFTEPLPPKVEIPPKSDPGWEAAVEAWYTRHQKVLDMVSEADDVEIGLPHDGASFVDDTPGGCADRLEQLRALGYNVPQRAIDRLRWEQAQDAEGKERSDP